MEGGGKDPLLLEGDKKPSAYRVKDIFCSQLNIPTKEVSGDIILSKCSTGILYMSVLWFLMDASAQFKKVRHTNCLELMLYRFEGTVIFLQFLIIQSLAPLVCFISLCCRNPFLKFDLFAIVSSVFPSVYAWVLGQDHFHLFYGKCKRWDFGPHTIYNLNFENLCTLILILNICALGGVYWECVHFTVNISSKSQKVMGIE